MFRTAGPLPTSLYRSPIMVLSDSMKNVMSTLRQIPDADAKIAGFALFALMFFCVLSGASNRIAGTGVSREGSNWIHMKFVPVPMHQQVLALYGPFIAWA